MGKKNFQGKGSQKQNGQRNFESKNKNEKSFSKNISKGGFHDKKKPMDTKHVKNGNSAQQVNLKTKGGKKG